MNEKSNPSISVIMPIYNAEEYLKESIESILSQSFKDFEFVIVNDGSVDSSKTIVESFDDDRIRFIDRHHEGFAKTLNAAIKASKGRYLARIDSDDFAEVDRLKLQFEFMEQNPDVGILGAQGVLVDPEGKVVGDLKRPVSQDCLSKYIEYACPVIHSTYFVRKEVYEALEGYRDIPPVEDYDLLFRASELGYKIQNLPDQLVQYRINPTGMTLKNLQRSIYFTLKVQKMHRLRTNNQADDSAILNELQNYNRDVGGWFLTVYKLRKVFLNSRAKLGKPVGYIMTGFAALSTLLHVHLFINGVNGILAKRYCR